MLKSIVASCLVQAVVVTAACAAGPFGTIRVGAWSGGAYTDDGGGFSHCAAGSDYASGVSLIVDQKKEEGFVLNDGAAYAHAVLIPVLEIFLNAIEIVEPVRGAQCRVAVVPECRSAKLVGAGARHHLHLTGATARR